MNQKKRHFLVVAAASRGARFFVKKALSQGHDVTAICRADDDQGALDRVTGLIQERNLTAGGVPAACRRTSRGTQSASGLATSFT